MFFTERRYGINIVEILCKEFSLKIAQCENVLRLIDEGAANIDLVTPSHYVDAVIESLSPALPVPVIWNCGGYESVETLRRLEGLVQIYLPDMKYALSGPAARYSSAPDYPEVADAAIKEMFRQTGPYVIGEDGLLKRGVVVRHLILPENIENTEAVIKWFAASFKKGDAFFSLMSQYTPPKAALPYPELMRPISAHEYALARVALYRADIADGFYQARSSAKAEYIPDFNLSGIIGHGE